MGRALSFSLVAHAAFILSFLLLSTTRQSLPVAPVVRPVRLVTYLEPGGAPRSRAVAAAARTVPAPPAARVIPTPTPAEAPAVAAPSAAVLVPRVAIPVPGSAPSAPVPPPAAEARPALSERLARRLAAAAPAESRQAEVAAPRIASLPRPEPEAVSPSAPSGPPAAAGGGAPAAPGGPAVAPGGVEPVGYFPHAWYLALLKEQIFSRWAPPSEFFQSRRPPVALVSFRISRAGSIEAIALKESSGSARFDQSALAAIRGLRQVPGLPEQYREETLDVVIRFQNQK